MRDHLAQPTLSLDSARAAVCDPSGAVAHPWNVQDAWFLLKEAHGHPISREAAERLSPAHLMTVEETTPCDVIPLPWGGMHVAEQIEPYRLSALSKVRAMIGRGADPTGGDAA
jgi:hypothetical protein